MNLIYQLDNLIQLGAYFGVIQFVNHFLSRTIG